MNAKILSSLLALMVIISFSACEMPDIEDEDSDSYESGYDSSSSSYDSHSGSCYYSSSAQCGYYYDLSDSEYNNLKGGCYNWYDEQNICDGKTEQNHGTTNDTRNTQICTMPTSNSDSTMKSYMYGLTQTYATQKNDECNSHSGWSGYWHSY